MLSYRRERAAVQLGLVLAKKSKTERGDNILRTL